MLEDRYSERVWNHLAMLSQSIRTKLTKLKTKMNYHTQETSQSMALKYKKNERFNGLDCKSFSMLCSKLYYKYIASGVAPLEVNICSATAMQRSTSCKMNCIKDRCNGYLKMTFG
eukprot:1027524_1